MARGSRPELLDLYRDAWGEPAEGPLLASSRDGHEEFWILRFEPEESPIARYVTLGLGSCFASDDRFLGVELLLVLDEPDSFPRDAVATFMVDLGVHLLRTSCRPAEGSTVSEVTTPRPWAFDAVVFDSPRGEPSEFEEFVADRGLAIRLMWTIPVSVGEAALVRDSGIEAFDALVERSGVSLVHLQRLALA